VCLDLGLGEARGDVSRAVPIGAHDFDEEEPVKELDAEWSGPTPHYNRDSLDEFQSMRCKWRGIPFRFPRHFHFSDRIIYLANFLPERGNPETHPGGHPLQLLGVCVTSASVQDRDGAVTLHPGLYFPLADCKSSGRMAAMPVHWWNGSEGCAPSADFMWTSSVVATMPGAFNSSASVGSPSAPSFGSTNPGDCPATTNAGPIIPNPISMFACAVSCSNDWLITRSRDFPDTLLDLPCVLSIPS